MIHKKISLLVLVAFFNTTVNADFKSERFDWALTYNVKDSNGDMSLGIALNEQMHSLIADLTNPEPTRGAKDIFASFLAFLQQAQQAVLSGFNVAVVANSEQKPLIEVVQEVVENVIEEVAQDAADTVSQVVQDAVEDAIEAITGQDFDEETSTLESKSDTVESVVSEVDDKAFSIVISIVLDNQEDSELYTTIRAKLASLSDRINSNQISGEELAQEFGELYVMLSDLENASISLLAR